MSARVRYKTHATTLHRLGYSTAIPLKYKVPDAAPINKAINKSWTAGGDGFSLEDIKAIAAVCPVNDGIGLVMDGKLVFLDKDVAPPEGAASAEVAHINRVAGAIDTLIIGSLGQTMTRHSDKTKKLFVYRLAEPGTVETQAGVGFEIFSMKKSKQVAIYGPHPSGNEYRWEGDKGPVNTGFSQIPTATPDKIYKVRAKVLELLSDEGLLKPRVTRSTFSPTHRHIACDDSVSALLSELLRGFGQNPNKSHTDLASAFLLSALPGARSNTAAAAASALVLCGYDDGTIAASLAPAYRAVMALTGEKPERMHRIVAGIRRGMSRKHGAPIRSVNELDALLKTGAWSLFR